MAFKSLPNRRGPWLTAEQQHVQDVLEVTPKQQTPEPVAQPVTRSMSYHADAATEAINAIAGLTDEQKQMLADDAAKARFSTPLQPGEFHPGYAA